jgi:hypothetical protein
MRIAYICVRSWGEKVSHESGDGRKLWVLRNEIKVEVKFELFIEKFYLRSEAI